MFSDVFQSVTSRSSLSNICIFTEVTIRVSVGGGKRDRTADPLLARQVLSQLSYTPIKPVYTDFENKCPDNPEH